MFVIRLVRRLVVAVAIGAAVFFASMILTLALRGERPLAASPAASGTLISEISPELVAPLLSGESVVVATTTPSTSVVVTTTTIVIPTRSRSAPLPERLAVADLACTWFDGEHLVIGAVANENLSFVSPLTEARSGLVEQAVDHPRWSC